MLSFTDISTYKKLQRETHFNRLLKALNTSVHHEMLAPLQTNVEVAERLVKFLKKSPKEMDMAQTILISSRMVMLHANDLLDQRIIENGIFVPAYEDGSIIEAIDEIVSLVRLTLKMKKKRLLLICNFNNLKNHPLLRFDKRRLQ